MKITDLLLQDMEQHIDKLNILGETNTYRNLKG